jgi:hypothetical protein
MKFFWLIILYCILFGSSACGSFPTPLPISLPNANAKSPPVSLPHEVAIVEPLKLSLTQTATGLRFTITCVNTLTYEDVKVDFQIQGVKKTFSYGQPFGEETSAPPPLCNDGKVALEGDLGHFQDTTNIIIYFAVLYPDRTYESAMRSYRVEPNGLIYALDN